MADVNMLIKVLQRLADGGNTVVVIEHNLDIIKVADYIIDLGPEGGDRGGTVVGVGSPEELAQMKHSYTGQFIKKSGAGLLNTRKYWTSLRFPYQQDHVVRI